MVAFVLVERSMGDDALIPLRIFRLRTAAVVVVASVMVGAAMFGAITVLPQYMQIVHGATPTQAGLMMLPMVVGMMTAGIVTGQITSRTGRIRGFPIAGSAMAGVAMVALSRVTADTSLGWMMAGMVVLGLGLGQCMQPLTIIVQNAVPPREIGVATSSATFFRQLGGTLGVAVFLSLLFSSLGQNILTAVRAAVPGIQRAVAAGDIPRGPVDEQVLESLRGAGSASDGVFGAVQDDSSIIGQMSPVLSHPFKVGFADSMSLVLLGGGLVMLLAFVVLLLMPAVELRATSASAAARAEDSAARAAATAPMSERTGRHRAENHAAVEPLDELEHASTDGATHAGGPSAAVPGRHAGATDGVTDGEADGAGDTDPR